jgi:glass
MNSFSALPPLESLEPLPSLFPFTPCSSANYGPTHDVADVLLSLKNAVLKPNGETHSCLQNGANQVSQAGYGSASNGSLSYTVHHPQILLSPSSHHHHYYPCHQNQSQNSYAPSSYYDSQASCPGHQHYPSMSVNVQMNMNMTMHGYADGPCSQVNTCCV